MYAIRSYYAEAQIDQQIAQLRILNGMGRLLGVYAIDLNLEAPQMVAGAGAETEMEAPAEEPATEAPTDGAS